MNWADFFRYEDGNLIRVVTTSSRAIEGMVAGSLSGNGYLHINIDGGRVKKPPNNLGNAQRKDT